MDLTHKPSKHFTGLELGHVAMLHSVTFGFMHNPEAHFYGASFGHPFA
jgi:hypothetical protein